MALGITNLELMAMTEMKCDLQFMSMKLSDDLQLQSLQNAEVLKKIEKRHARNLEDIRAKYDPKSNVSYTDPTKIAEVGERADQAIENSQVVSNLNGNESLEDGDFTDTVASEVARENAEATQRDNASYAAEMREIQAEQSRYETETSTHIAENNSKEKVIEQQLASMESRLKSINANLESLVKLRDDACKKFAPNFV